MLKTKKVLSVLLIVAMVLSMCSSIFTVSVSAADESVDQFVFRPFKAVDAPVGYTGKNIKTSVIFVCNDERWKDAEDGERVYIDYGVKEGSAPECYWLTKGQNAFSSISDALANSTSKVIKIGPGVYDEKVSVAKSGYTFYGNYAGVNPNADFDSLELFYEVPLNPEREDSSLETQVTNTWNWAKTTSYITCDGFTITQKGQFFASYSGGNCTNNSFYNIIFTGQTTYGINCDYGSNYNTVVKYNRIVDNTTGANLLFGGGFYNLDMQYNYFANNTGKVIRFTSIGNNSGIESQLNISNNIFNNNSNYIDFEYTHGHGTLGNLDYKRITDNVFYNCGASAGSIMSLNYHPDQSGSYDPNVDNMNTASKTFISRNTFYSIPSGVSPIKLNGADTIKTKTLNYKVSVVENKFVFASEAGGKAIACTIYGTLDASKNFVGECSKGIGKEKALSDPSAAYEVSSNIVSVTTMPYYLDYEMTTMSSVVTLEPGNEADIAAAGIAQNGVTVNNDKMEIVITAAAGAEQVDLSKALYADNTTYAVYKDYLMENQAEDGVIYITGDRTVAYIYATNSETGVTTSYTVSIVANTDKTLAELKYIVEQSTDAIYNDTVVSGNEIKINLTSDKIYFPFELIISPSASYKLYTDVNLKTEYTDSSFYMKPDTDTVIYAAVTSGDGKKTEKYKLSFARTGSDAYDAQIIDSITPDYNVLIMNSRKRVSFMTVALVDEIVFDFKVSDNASYTIYEDKELTKPVSSGKEPKTVKLPDGITKYYIKVESIFGYSQVYQFTTYNDVRSTDNLVYGVTGLDKVTIEDNVIHISASSTLSVVNAHFDTDVFADVKLYADENKTFEIESNNTYITVNGREVPVRTFQLGNSARKSYFYLTVTSETGVPNDYLVILTKQDVSGAIDFVDVPAKHWAKPFIDKASELGLVTGVLNTETNKYNFYPNNNMTRQEVAVVLCTMLGIEPYSFRGVAIGSVFDDANDIPEWSYNYIKAVYALGSMQGDDEGNFRYKDNITRQEFFVAIAGILKLDTEGAKDYSLAKFKDASKVSDWALNATKAVVEAGIIEGDNGNLNPRANITRAEVATIIAKCHKLDK